MITATRASEPGERPIITPPRTRATTNATTCDHPRSSGLGGNGAGLAGSGAVNVLTDPNDTGSALTVTARTGNTGRTSPPDPVPSAELAYEFAVEVEFV